MDSTILFQSIIYISIGFFSIGALFFFVSGLSFRRNALSSNDVRCQVDISESFVFSKINNLISGVRDLEARQLVPNVELTHAASEIGVGNIEFLLSKLIDYKKESPYLFGVNKGGAFIANYLAHRMKLHEKYLVKCDYNVEYQKIYCEDREIRGPIILVDDVVRSGKTLSVVRSYLQDKYPDSRIYCMVLVFAGDKDDLAKIKRIVDYFPWITQNKEISLLWSSDSRPDIPEVDAEDFFNDKEMDQIVGRIIN
jgi:hypothetical protein